MKKILLSLVFLAAGTFTAIAQDYTESQEGFLLNVGVHYGIGFSGSYEYYNDWERDYRRENNRGLTLDVSLYYKLDNYNCIGFVYTNYSTDMETNNVYAYAPGNSYEPIGITDVRNEVSVSLYAPSYMVNFRLPENTRHEFNIEQAIGYIRYKEDAYYPELYEIRGGGIGFLSSLSYRYEIIDNFVIGPKISYTTGIVFGLNVTGPGNYDANIGLLDDDMRSVNRFDVGLSACYRF